MWWDLGIMPLLLFYISNLFNYLHTGLVAQWSWQGKVYSFELSCVLSTWGSSCCGLSWTCSVHLPEFDPLCARLSPSRCLTCSWACRMSSGPWRIVVVRVSWPGHPTWIKKKKNLFNYSKQTLISRWECPWELPAYKTTNVFN